MRFRSEQHLRRPADIRAVREQGRRVDARAFILLWRERAAALPASAAPADSIVRVCVVASGKAVGGAVLRNRAKRRLREVFRHQQHRAPPRCDLVLIARAASGLWPMAELENRFTEACTRIAPATP